jgi:hypothetical protein
MPVMAQAPRLPTHGTLHQLVVGRLLARARTGQVERGSARMVPRWADTLDGN